MDDVPIRDESIRLGQFLKLANLIDTGSDAKELMVQGLVTVNDEVETRRGRQLVPGDVVRRGGAQARGARGYPGRRATRACSRPGGPGASRTSSTAKPARPSAL